MDYRRPAGRKITIQVTRIRASDPGKRLGALLVNPGGPGGSGVNAPTMFITSTGLAPLAVDYDLIGFDPRGVGDSEGVPCQDDYTQPPSTMTAKQKARFVADQHTRAFNACESTDPDFSAQLTTENAARDLDSIRVALGEKKISFYGVSWGTALGAYYRSLFDDHVDRMVLDSVMPPRFELAAIDEDTDAALEHRFDTFATWIAERDSDYHFGTTARQVRASIFALREELTGHPRTAGPTVFDRSAVTRLMLNARYHWASQWPVAARQLAVLRDGGVPTQPAALANDLGKDDDKYKGAFAFQATNCNASTSSRDFEIVWGNQERLVQRYPAADGYSTFAFDCLGWPQAPHQWRLRPAASPLQLAAHADETSTPFPWAVAMHRRIGGGLITVRDDSHGSLPKPECAPSVLDFFRTGSPVTIAC